MNHFRSDMEETNHRKIQQPQRQENRDDRLISFGPAWFRIESTDTTL